MAVEDEKWEILHLFSGFLLALFFRRPVAVMLALYVWETFEVVAFDCCGLFDDGELEQHETMWDALVLDPLQGFLGVLLGMYVAQGAHLFAQKSTMLACATLAVGCTSVVFAGVYPYEDDDGVPWGLMLFAAIVLLFLAAFGAAAAVYAHTVVLLGVPPVLTALYDGLDPVVATWVALVVSAALHATHCVRSSPV